MLAELRLTESNSKTGVRSLRKWDLIFKRNIKMEAHKESVFLSLIKAHGEDTIKSLQNQAAKNHKELKSNDAFAEWLADYAIESVGELFEEYNIDAD